MNKNFTKGLFVVVGLATAAAIVYLIKRSESQETLTQNLNTWIHEPADHNWVSKPDDHNADHNWVSKPEVNSEAISEVYDGQSDEYVDVTEEVSTPEDLAGMRTISPEELESEIIEESLVIIGDGEGEISRTSKEYRELINDAYGKAISDEDPTLILYGKTNGLGARGEVVDEVEGLKGRMYQAEDIIKLRNRMLNSK